MRKYLKYTLSVLFSLDINKDSKLIYNFNGFEKGEQPKLFTCFDRCNLIV